MMSLCVMVVEDEPSLRLLLQKVFTRRGHRVHVAASAREALSLWANIQQEVSVVVTDIQMPGSTGLELALSLRRERPTLPIIFVSGCVGETPLPAPLPPHTAFLKKPFSLPELLRAAEKLTLRSA